MAEMARQLRQMAAPLSSHLSCSRCAPEDRRQLSAWQAMNDSQNDMNAARIGAWVSVSQPEWWLNTVSCPLEST